MGGFLMLSIQIPILIFAKIDSQFSIPIPNFPWADCKALNQQIWNFFVHVGKAYYWNNHLFYMV